MEVMLVVVMRADGPGLVAGLREYDVLRAFPPGRLEALTANDMPDAQGLTGTTGRSGSGSRPGRSGGVAGR